jgi:hypothetical protein
MTGTVAELLAPLAFLLSLAGAWLVASEGRRARWWGWLLLLAASVILAAWASLGGHHWLLAMQCGFVATSIRGMRRDRWKPAAV